MKSIDFKYLIAKETNGRMRIRLLALSHIKDGAGWHTNDTALAFEHITLVRLPAYSPELNPAEQIWQWLRQNELANKCPIHRTII